jgi:hypothetical protein
MIFLQEQLFQVISFMVRLVYEKLFVLILG